MLKNKDYILFALGITSVMAFIMVYSLGHSEVLAATTIKNPAVRIVATTTVRTVKNISTSTVASTSRPIAPPIQTRQIPFIFYVNSQGAVNFGGGYVSAINGNTITATSTLNDKILTVTINTNNGTTINYSGKNLSVSDLTLGLGLSVQGTFDSFSQNGVTITAKTIRLYNVIQSKNSGSPLFGSIQKGKQNFFGKFWGFVTGFLKWK